MIVLKLPMTAEEAANLIGVAAIGAQAISGEPTSPDDQTSEARRSALAAMDTSKRLLLILQKAIEGGAIG